MRRVTRRNLLRGVAGATALAASPGPVAAQGPPGGERRQALDGAFVYAVRSTKIFCRPSCPSRKPQRHNVVFFAVPELATRAGYRPCKRCRPEIAEPQDPRLAAVRAVCAHLDRAESPPTLSALGAAAVLAVRPALPYALAFAAGAMIYVVVEELIPESQSADNTDLATLGAMTGFTVMMILDVSLG